MLKFFLRNLHDNLLKHLEDIVLKLKKILKEYFKMKIT